MPCSHSMDGCCDAVGWLVGYVWCSSYASAVHLFTAVFRSAAIQANTWASEWSEGANGVRARARARAHICSRQIKEANKLRCVAHIEIFHTHTHIQQHDGKWRNEKFKMTIYPFSSWWTDFELLLTNNNVLHIQNQDIPYIRMPC